jgi:hypothetical protein
MPVRSLQRAVVFALIGFAGGAAHASFHFMQIEQAVGGVNGDPSAQAIQLRMRAAGQNILSQTRLVVRDAAGGNPILLEDMTANVPNSQAGRRILIATPNFSKHTSVPATPDFIMDPIPVSYLAAGRLTFEDDFGTIYWSLSWGGTNYTGSQTGSTVNDADGNFGPAFNGILPSSASSDIRALQFTGAAGAASTGNSLDYAVTPGAPTFINNANLSFTVLNLVPNITAVSQESNDVRVTWLAQPGRTNVLQRAVGLANGGSSTNFIDISPNAFGGTNYLDVGAVTNFPSAFYRVRLRL